MKFCLNCAASNTDAADFCRECGVKFVATRPLIQLPPNAARPLEDGGATGDPVDKTVRSNPLSTKQPAARERRIKLPPAKPSRTVRSPKSRSELDADILANTISSRLGDLSAFRKKQRADIMFVLDCTESMKGEIQAVKEVIFSFVDTIRSDGVRVRIGLTAFRDRLNNEEPQVLRFNGDAFTDDPDLFKDEARHLEAIGGGDEPESSLDAVMLALKQPFAADAQKVIVLITDAPPHIPDKETKSIDEVTEALRESSVSQFYLVIPVQETKNQIYLRLCEGTRSVAFDLGRGDDIKRRAEDFKRTLMSLGKTISVNTK